MTGRFANAMDEAVYELTLEGWCTEETGSVQDNGTWFGKVDGPIPAEADLELTQDQVAELAQCIGAIVAEDSQGFISVGYYRAGAEDQYESAWASIEADVASWYEEDSEESEG